MLFWNTAQRMFVVIYRPFRKNLSAPWPLKMGPIYYPETFLTINLRCFTPKKC